MKIKLILLGTLMVLSLRAGLSLGMHIMYPLEDDYYQEVKNSGINYAHIYVSILTQEERVKNFLDTAEKNGLKALLCVYRHKTTLDDPQFAENYRQAIRKFKDHPALGMWYIADEPRGEELHGKLQQIYRILKEETPDIPVAICLNWTKDIALFKDCGDIMMPDLYPVENQEFPAAPLRNFTYFVWDMCRQGKPVIPISQIMNWKSYPDKMKNKKIDPSSCRYPNDEELRYLNFSSMVMNVKGIFYYSFYDVQRNKNLDYLTSSVGPAVTELRDFGLLIENAGFTYLTGTIGKGKVPEYFASSWTNADAAYVVLTNNTDKELSGEIKLAAKLPSGNLIPWGKTRQAAAASTGSVIKLDKLNPWEVMIWKLEKTE